MSLQAAVTRPALWARGPSSSGSERSVSILRSSSSHSIGTHSKLANWVSEGTHLGISKGTAVRAVERDRKLGCRARGFGVWAVRSSFGGADRLSGDGQGSAGDGEGLQERKEENVGGGELKGIPLGLAVPAAIVGVGALAAVVALAVGNGDASAILSAVSKSGFPAAFALIFVSELGDKTFFIAALMAMRYSKWPVLVGASAALAVMTVISVAIGKLCQSVPAQLQTTLPVGEYAAVALLVWFGLRSIKAAWDAPAPESGVGSDGELEAAEEFLKKKAAQKAKSGLEVLGEAFTLIFVAEWGDRSMLATIALGAAQSAVGVASGAIAGHVLATAIAVVGGALLSRYLSEKVIGYFGGVLFLAFAAATLAGVF